MNSPLLGVHVITRDEEDVLPQCLDSVKTVADEIVIVDTGSVDRTVDIAISYGAKIVHTKWDDDFSKARNLGLSHATTDWILVLDADEALAAGAELLADLLQRTDAEAFLVEIENVLGDRPEDRLRHQTVRLFRRNASYRFRGRIHEQIIPAILEHHPLTKIELSPLQIVHYGYLPPRMERKDKIRRNLRLLEMAVKEEPEEPFHIYNLGVTHCQMGRLREAASELQRAYDLTPVGRSYRPTLVRDRAKVLLALNELAEAERLLRAEITHYDDYPDLYHLLGETLERKGLLRESFAAYEQASRCGAAPCKYVTEAGMGTFRSFQRMANLANEWGAVEEAVALYRQALGQHPGYVPALTGLAESLHRLGMADEQILEHLQTATADRLLQASVMAEIGAYPEALALLNRIHPLSLAGEKLRCECLMQTGQFPEAYEKLGVLLREAAEPGRQSLLLDRALCCWSEERSLPFRFYTGLSPEQQHMFACLDGWLIEKKVPDSVSQPFVQNLLERAVQLRLLRIADALGQLSSDWFLAYAKCLYRNGFVLLAADCLLQAMKTGSLDGEGLFLLAELLYDKGHFRQACALFEQILAEAPTDERARTGAALCYLGIAEEVAVEGIGRFPDHPALQADLQRIRASKEKLRGIRWHTCWKGAQRRNLYASANDFIVYDRQK
ncbi:TPR domain-containing glycosyltransferase [Effusibacillus pohliae]|uniref:TPR domain-containing glycosyltransferase n=1 Tax=Effusibacillus pohliae TaxID=232270 RepID=UPI000360AB99|nr:TPR domain-containing glycosyltransferase [Effusibacillus pohliae]